MDKYDTEIIKNELLSYCNKKIFSGCSLGVFFEKNDKTEKYIWYTGKTGFNSFSRRVDKSSYFDLASLTKPLVTLLSLFALQKMKNIDFDENIEKFLPDGVLSTKKRKITLKNLICHRSGLPAHRDYFKELINIDGQKRKKRLLQLVLHEKLMDNPGKTYLYSDLDYMLLGYIIEIQSGKELGTFWKDSIIKPLGITEKFYTCGSERSEQNFFVETGKCRWSGKNLHGRVHDDNCRAVGTLLGHAGLFARAEGVMDMCEFLLHMFLGKKKHPCIDSGLFLHFLKKRKEKQWAHGFDVVSKENSSSGIYFSNETIGHLGFTGTSFWIDLKKKIGVFFLTNRVLSGDDIYEIRRVRPAIHNSVMRMISRE